MVLLDPLARSVPGLRSPWLVAMAWVASTVGDSAVYLVPIGIALLWVASLRPTALRVDAALRQLWLALLFAFIAIAASGLAVNVIKRVIGRVRPNSLGDLPTLSFDVLGWDAKHASFPSGHAMTIAAVGAVIFLFAGRRSLPLLLAAIVFVGAGRIILGAHFPADVVAGAFFGWFLTVELARFLARRGLVFRETASDGLVPRGTNAAKTLRALIARRGAF